jgi:AraC-like DNA-binding protein
MAGLCDRTTPIEDLSTRLWRSLEPVRESIRLDDWVVRLEREFASCVGRREDALIAEAVGRMERTRGLVEIGRLARDLGISSRQLERRFLKLVGLTPKVFCRMQRFQEVFRAIDENQPNWLEAALSAGYYDQAHLIRDFRDLAGEPPAALLNGNDLARHFLQRGDLSHFSKTCERDSV